MIAGQRHDHIAVAIVGRTDRRALAVFEFDRDHFFRIENLQKVADESRIERDRKLSTVVSNWQLDSRLSQFGGPAAEDQRPGFEVEIDAAALFAGDDRGLANGRMERSDG